MREQPYRNISKTFTTASGATRAWVILRPRCSLKNAENNDRRPETRVSAIAQYTSDLRQCLHEDVKAPVRLQGARDVRHDRDDRTQHRAVRKNEIGASVRALQHGIDPLCTTSILLLQTVGCRFFAKPWARSPCRNIRGSSTGAHFSRGCAPRRPGWTGMPVRTWHRRRWRGKDIP